MIGKSPERTETYSRLPAETRAKIESDMKRIENSTQEKCEHGWPKDEPCPKCSLL